MRLHVDAWRLLRMGGAGAVATDAIRHTRVGGKAAPVSSAAQAGPSNPNKHRPKTAIALLIRIPNPFKTDLLQPVDDVHALEATAGMTIVASLARHTGGRRCRGDVGLRLVAKRGATELGHVADHAQP